MPTTMHLPQQKNAARNKDATTKATRPPSCHKTRPAHHRSTSTDKDQRQQPPSVGCKRGLNNDQPGLADHGVRKFRMRNLVLRGESNTAAILRYYCHTAMRAKTSPGQSGPPPHQGRNGPSTGLFSQVQLKIRRHATGYATKGVRACGRGRASRFRGA